jgi:hypothetical protein
MMRNALYGKMRTHADIINDAGGAAALHDKLGLLGKIHTVRSWGQRDSIPADQWKAIADAGLATLEELAEAAALKRGSPEPMAPGAAA